MNVYYNPDEYGYTLVGVLDEEDLSYEFNMLCVWMDDSGRLRWAQDSGCSCPSPFEDYVDPSGDPWPQLIERSRAEFETVLRDFRASPAEKQRLRVLARKPFGVTVLVTDAGATRL